ncbi:unnamed protein product [Toxocara canis]|uniref:Uncharacterized protein n=1 Tax=Toxocara canis TaxID=6265 RepID=A0A3P7HG87_TOXCA|nr:unnamed protein product [Toxocara canis]
MHHDSGARHIRGIGIASVNYATIILTYNEEGRRDIDGVGELFVVPNDLQLIENCEALSDDLERAHDKIDSLRGVCTRNATQLEELRRQRETETNDITTVVDSWNQITQQEASVMDSHCERLLSQLRSSEQMLSKQMSGLIAQMEKSAKEMEKTVNRAHEEAIAEYGNHTDNVLAAVVCFFFAQRAFITSSVHVVFTGIV